MVSTFSTLFYHATRPLTEVPNFVLMVCAVVLFAALRTQWIPFDILSQKVDQDFSSAGEIIRYYEQRKSRHNQPE